MNNKAEELMRKYHYGFKHSKDLLEDEYVKDLNKEIERLKNEVDELNNIINELEKELDNLIIFNQSNITCNHYTPDDWKDSKLIGNMLYKMKPVSFLAQELKDKLKALKEGMSNE